MDAFHPPRPVLAGVLPMKPRSVVEVQTSGLATLRNVYG
jgi:hypothetical protein